MTPGADLDGMVAVITGGASGIGAAAVAEFLRRGARTVVIDRQPCARSSLSLVADVGDAEAIRAAVDTAADRCGGIDVLVNNAGIGAVGDVSANSDDEWHRVLDVNVVGIARVTRAALPHLRSSPCASIVNTCSVVAQVGVPQRALYAASKGAVAALTLAMAADHVRDGIRVNAVVPGTAGTPWVERLLADSADPEQAAQALRARQPLGRLVTAEEVAFVIVNLASPASSATTGALVAVDGGMTGLRLPN